MKTYGVKTHLLVTAWAAFPVPLFGEWLLVDP